MRTTDPRRTIVYTADLYRGADVLRSDRKADPLLMPTLMARIPDAWRSESLPATRSDIWGLGVPDPGHGHVA